MKRVAALCLSSLALVPAYSFAADGTVVCNTVHFVRFQGAELRSTAIDLRNVDLVHPTTVERITIRNAFGDVVHDSGPATAREHPRNADFTPALDITVVPPGASYYLTTNHIWGNNGIPDVPQTGQSMSATVQFSKEGKAALFVVGGNNRTREFPNGAEKSRDDSQCTRVRSSSDDD
jgi:hypothetical protein